MRNYWKVLFFFGLQLLSVPGYAQQISVNSLRYTTNPKLNRMMFDVTASPQHRVFVMDNPSRLVIDIKNAQLEHSLNQPVAEHPLFNRVRAGVKDGTDLRIVVDLKAPINSKKFSLKSNNSNEQHLVIDLYNQDPIIATKTDDKETSKSIARKPLEPQTIAAKSIPDKAIEPKRANRIVIAIDPGHGGNDPGAHGSHGTEEKKVTFAIAKKLEALINQQRGMKAVMVRKGDYYVGLRNRMQIARDYADHRPKFPLWR